MPYIKRERRERILLSEAPIMGDVLVNADAVNDEGELNFAITTLLLRYVAKREHTYANLNAVIGVLEASKLEFYRRVIAPYEDGKILANGDVYRPTMGNYKDGTV